MDRPPEEAAPAAVQSGRTRRAARPRGIASTIQRTDIDMKKTLLALAAASLLATAVQAQVHVSGRLNSALGKAVGSDDRAVFDIANSLLAFSGLEKLNSRYSALFGFEHRFFSNNGADASTGGRTFWNGYSFVGLKHADYGYLLLGRFYTAAFMAIQDRLDPFRGNTVAALRGAGLTPFGYYLPQHMALLTANYPLIKARNAQSIYYSLRSSAWRGQGFDFKVNIAATPAGQPDRPWSVGANYRVGDLFVGIGHEDSWGVNDELTTLGASYDLGPVTLAAGTSRGRDNANRRYKGYLVGGTWTVSPAGSVQFGYATSELGGTDLYKKFGIGYRHALSKRVTLYADAAHDSVPTSNGTGYDVGIEYIF